ncbi:ATPase, T2SS/T4P/T4SS family [Pyxidicoccus sp. 3LFB2]
MTTPPLKPEPPSTPDSVFASLLAQLDSAGRAPSKKPASPSTPEALAAALFDVAASTGAVLFSVWAAEDAADDEAEEGGAAVPATQLNAGISFFFLPEAGTEEGPLGSDLIPVRQPLAYALYRPLGQALAVHAKRGADPRMPQRGSVSFPAGSADPDLEFRVSFRDDALGTWTTAVARDRETRQSFPSIASLPLPTNAAAFLDAHFRQLNQALFSGQVVLLTGVAGTGRSTTLRALMDALPDNVNALAAVEEPRASAGGGIRMVKVGQALTLVQATRSFLRQDPDVIFADEVRTLEDLQLLCNGALTGHAVACVLEAKTPEDGHAWMTEAIPGLPMRALIVHHTRDAATGTSAMTLHETKPTEDGSALRILPWTPPG